MYADTIRQIMTASEPTPNHAPIRNLARKQISDHVRALLKSLGIKGVSVTTPNYSMAQSIDISLPDDDRHEHQPYHEQAEAEYRATHEDYMGAMHFCHFCREDRDAKDRLERLILTAFPDLADKSDLQSDYFDYRLSIN